MASAEYESIRNKVDAVTVYLIHIHFDEFFDIPEMDFYFATTAYVECFIDGENLVFEDYLRGYPSVRHQTDRGNDIAEFSLNNPSNEMYARFRTYEQIIERGYTKIYQAFEIEKDYYEAEIVFVGYLEDFTITESDKTLDFTAFSDMSRPNFLVGNRILTRERCGAEFNYQGLAAPDALRPCTWQTIQGGNEDFCSKFLEGVDGCEAHNNTHQFFAVEGLATAEISIVSQQENPDGFPYGTGSTCFTKNTFVVMADNSIKQINLIKVGDMVFGLSPNNGLHRNETKVRAVHKKLVQEILIVEFESGLMLETTEEHPFRSDVATFTPIGFLQGKRVLGNLGTEKTEYDTVKRLKPLIKETMVYHLTTDWVTFIVTDINRTFECHCHNKPSVPIYY
jgi:hypothetical protein